MSKFVVTAINMKSNCGSSNNLLEINQLYLSNRGWFSKEYLHDYLKGNPNSIFVENVFGPALIAAKSINGEKYVKSSPNNKVSDNLLRLPRL